MIKRKSLILNENKKISFHPHPNPCMYLWADPRVRVGDKAWYEGRLVILQAIEDKNEILDGNENENTIKYVRPLVGHGSEEEDPWATTSELFAGKKWFSL